MLFLESSWSMIVSTGYYVPKSALWEASFRLGGFRILVAC